MMAMSMAMIMVMRVVNGVRYGKEDPGYESGVKETVFTYLWMSSPYVFGSHKG